MKRLISILMVVVISSSVYAAWDLAGDWSETDNPNGAWAYGGGTLNPAAFTVYGQRTDNWLAGDLDDPLPQPAWVPWTGWFQSVNNNPYGKDLLIGDVATHGPAQIRWTSPVTGTIHVTGNGWQPRHIGRDLSLWLFESDTATGTFLGMLGATTRAAPLTFDLTFDVTAGQNVYLSVGPENGGDFVAVNMTIVPEPMTLGLLALGALTLFTRKHVR